MPTLKHQLHAIWLFFEISCAGGCLLETGAEELLTLKSSGMLGNIPVIVVLTKYDKLVDRMDRTLDETSLIGLSDKVIRGLAKNKAEAELQEICIRPLEKFAARDIPHVATSTHEGYQETLTHLIQITENCVGQHCALEAVVMTSIAQRVDPELKMMASIEVGKRSLFQFCVENYQIQSRNLYLAGYWKTLASSTTFKNLKSSGD